MPAHPIRIDIWHNILWSRYKGEVFSSLYKINNPEEFDLRFIHIAETEKSRTKLNDVDLACHRYPYTLTFKGAIGDISRLQLVKALFLHVFRSDADMIFITGYHKPEFWAQLAAAKLRRKRTALFCDSTVYDQPHSYVKSLFKRMFFTSVDAIFGYGLRSKEYAVMHGAKPEKFHVRCQAAALPLDYSAEKALSLRKSLGGASARFLFVGRLIPEKSLETLLRAFAKIKKLKPEAELVLVGDGPLKEKLMGYAQNLSLDVNSVFVGSKSGKELFEEYAKATCLVLPSISEVWGLVVNEALSYGCPVIVSERCGCAPELVVEGKTGFSHRAEDVDDLFSKMLAASECFADVEKTARTCIDLMSNYTSDKSAQQIVDGIRKTFKPESKKQYVQ